MELVDTATGKVISVEKRRKTTRDGREMKGQRRGGKNRGVRFHQVLDGDGTLVTVPKGTNPDILPRKEDWVYCETTATHILHRISEGATIEKISREPGFPSRHVIFRWLQKYPEFAVGMKEARKARADYFADKAIETAEQATVEEVAADRLRVDTYKWGAEVGDRETYGKATKISGDAASPLAFVIETGVRLPEDDAKPVTSEVVGE